MRDLGKAQVLISRGLEGALARWDRIGVMVAAAPVGIIERDQEHHHPTRAQLTAGLTRPATTNDQPEEGL